MTVPLLDSPRTVVDWQAIKGHLDVVNRVAADDLAAIWKTARKLPLLEAREYMLTALEIVLETYGATAADISAQWWNEMMVDPRFLAEPVTGFDQAQLKMKTRWGTAPILTSEASAYARMAGVVQQAIFGAHRNTVKVNAVASKVGYARYARPDACAFCRILASRGAVYGSKAGAMYVGAATVRKHYSDGKDRGYRLKQGRVRGVQSAGEKFHDHCRCVVAPSFSHLDMNFPDYQSRFESEYDEATELLRKDDPYAPLTVQRVTAAMRQLGYGA